MDVGVVLLVQSLGLTQLCLVFLSLFQAEKYDHPFTMTVHTAETMNDWGCN